MTGVKAENEEIHRSGKRAGRREQTRCPAPTTVSTLTDVAAARILVTGSSGHLGEALVRVLRDGGHDVTLFCEISGVLAGAGAQHEHAAAWKF